MERDVEYLSVGSADHRPLKLTFGDEDHYFSPESYDITIETAKIIRDNDEFSYIPAEMQRFRNWFKLRVSWLGIASAMAAEGSYVQPHRANLATAALSLVARLLRLCGRTRSDRPNTVAPLIPNSACPASDPRARGLYAALRARRLPATEILWLEPVDGDYEMLADLMREHRDIRDARITFACTSSPDSNARRKQAAWALAFRHFANGSIRWIDAEIVSPGASLDVGTEAITR